MIVAFYSGVRDAVGVSFDLPRDDLITLLEAEAKIPADPADKALTTALSTARYAEGMTRAKANAQDASAIALDVDEGWTLDEAEAAITEMMTPFVIYTTTKHTAAQHRFRIVLFLDRPVDADEYERLWFGLAKLWGATMDMKTRDISRLSIMPRQWAEAANEIRTERQGAPLNVDAILSLYPHDIEPEPKPVPRRAAFWDPLGEARADLRRLRNTQVDPDTLTDLNHSPIISKKTLDECLTSSSGGRTFRLLCSVAMSARRQGYDIGIDHLVAISRAFSDRAGRKRITEFEHRHDSRNAMQWAEKQVL